MVSLLCWYLRISYSIPRMHPSQIFNPASIFSLITLHAFRDISFQFEYACMPAYACNPPEGTRIPKCTPDASCRLWRSRTYINSGWSSDYIRFTKIWCQHSLPVSEYEDFMLRNSVNPMPQSAQSFHGQETSAFLMLLFHSRCLPLSSLPELSFFIADDPLYDVHHNFKANLKDQVNSTTSAK